MALTINTNLNSLLAQRHLSQNSRKINEISERLASGSRINHAKDDAAGLAMAMKMTSRINGYHAASRNASDAISYIQTAESASGSMMDSLQRMKELATLATNGTLGTSDRAKYDAEYQELSKELDSIVGRTKFNGLAIIGGDAGAVNFQVGPDSGDVMAVTTTDLATLNASAGDLTDVANANTAMGNIDTAIDSLNTEIAKYGAYHSRLETTIRNLDDMANAQEAARSRIMDADMAKEASDLTKYQILEQAGIAMLAQANMSQQLALQLLR